MKSSALGTDILEAEVVQIDRHGFWLNVRGVEYFLSFEEFPWFKNAKVDQILHVELFHDTHLYWPDLDVDLSLDILSNPEQYPLIDNLESSSTQPDGVCNPV